MYIEMELKKGQVLINEGEPSDCIYFLRSGELAIYKYDSQSLGHNIIGHVEPGEMVGEMSFLDNLPRAATVKANTDCRVSIMNRAEFDKIFHAQDSMIQNLVKTLSERLRKTNSKVHL
ncbi:MAG: cyclic nucleotide-binding domain-containing protein [Bacteriovorax sp.]|jgi:CRP-like cAMP-binding protein